MKREDLIARLRNIARTFQNGPVEITLNEAADMLEADTKPLTEREIAKACLGIFDTDGNQIYHRLNSTLITSKVIEVVRAVEAAHGIGVPKLSTNCQTPRN